MYLDVPFVSQLDFGGNQHIDDPTGCWYASACMIAYSFEAGPRQGVPALYSRPLPQADGTTTIGHWTKGGVMDEEYIFWDNQDFMKQLGLAQ